MLARSVTRWNKARGKGLTHLLVTSITRNITDKNVFLETTFRTPNLDFFQNASFAGDPEDRKSTSGGGPCVFRSQICDPISWMCKKQTVVSPHSTSESEIISLDARLRMQGIPALQLWDGVLETCARSDAKGNLTRSCGNRHPLSHSIDHLSLDMVDHYPNNIPQSSFPVRNKKISRT